MSGGSSAIAAVGSP